MNTAVKDTALFGVVAVLLIGTGIIQGWNSALLILNMGLISAIMALGVNLQWGFAGLFNIGVMGFVALGGLAAVLVAFSLGVVFSICNCPGTAAAVKRRGDVRSGYRDFP